MLGGSRSRVARLGLNLGNFISVLFFFLSFSLSICSSRISSLVRSTFYSDHLAFDPMCSLYAPFQS